MENQNTDIANANNLSSAESDGESPLALDSAQVLFDGFSSSNSPLPRQRIALSRRRSRCFHRSISYINFWKSRSSYVVFGTVTLKIGKHTEDDIRRYWTILVKRIRYEYKQSIHFEYIKILDIGEKNGMIHIHFLANIWITFGWLKSNWLDITGDSQSVYLEAISSGRLSPRKASSYMAGYINKPHHRYTRSQKALPKNIALDWRYIYTRLAFMDKQKAIVLYDDWLKNYGRISWSAWLKRLHLRCLPKGQTLLDSG